MKTNVSNKILNIGLDFSMEFGENWLKPINKRLQNKFPYLTSDELEECNTICNEVNKTANNFVYENPIKGKPEIQFVDFAEFENFMKQKFDWISIKNLKRLYSQSCYYAFK